jgi:hypothetical protein
MTRLCYYENVGWRNGPAGVDAPRDPANPLRRLTAMTIAHAAHPSDEDHDDTVEAHYASLEREPEACLCYDGWHFLGHVVELPDGDEEIEYIRVPCRRCNA